MRGNGPRQVVRCHAHWLSTPLQQSSSNDGSPRTTGHDGGLITTSTSIGLKSLHEPPVLSEDPRRRAVVGRRCCTGWRTSMTTSSGLCSSVTLESTSPTSSPNSPAMALNYKSTSRTPTIICCVYTSCLPLPLLILCMFVFLLYRCRTKKCLKGNVEWNVLHVHASSGNICG